MSTQPETAPDISIVVPTLDAADVLARTLDAVAGGPDGMTCETIVVDGGSTDGTRAIAVKHGARVITAPRGRGQQLRAGGNAAAGDWLLFLHADTRPGLGWRQAVRVFARQPANELRAAVFGFRLDDESAAARRIERLVAWRTRVFGLPYGDQALLISRRLYDEIGGFRKIPLYEDVDIVRRIGRNRLDVLQVDAETSAGRYRAGGWWLRPARNLFCLGLYFLGLSPSFIARLYR